MITIQTGNALSRMERKNASPGNYYRTDYPAFPAWSVESRYGTSPLGPSEYAAGEQLFLLNPPEVVWSKFRLEAGNAAQSLWMTTYYEQVMKRVFRARQLNFSLGFMSALAGDPTEILSNMNLPIRYEGESDDDQRMRAACEMGARTLGGFETTDYAQAMYSTLARGVHPREALRYSRGPNGHSLGPSQIAEWQEILINSVDIESVLTPWLAALALTDTEAAQTFIADLDRLPLDVISGISRESDIAEITDIPSFPWNRNAYGMPVKSGSGWLEDSYKSAKNSLEKAGRSFTRAAVQVYKNPAEIPGAVLAEIRREVTQALGLVVKGSRIADEISGGGVMGDLGSAAFFVVIGAYIGPLGHVLPNANWAGELVGSAGQMFPNATTAAFDTGRALAAGEALPVYDWGELIALDAEQLAFQIMIAGSLASAGVFGATVGGVSLSAWGAYVAGGGALLGIAANVARGHGADDEIVNKEIKLNRPVTTLELLAGLIAGISMVGIARLEKRKA